MAKLKIKILFWSVNALFLVPTLLCLSPAHSSCAAQLSFARQLRADALDKVAKSSFDAQTKIWLAYVDASTFETAMTAMKHFYALIADAQGNASPTLIRLIKSNLGRSALEKVMAEDLESYLKHNGTKEITPYIMNSLVQRLFYFHEQEAIVPSEKVFETTALEISEFATRLDFLRNLDLRIKVVDDASFQKKIKEYFYYYVQEGSFGNVKLRQSLSSKQLRDVFRKSESEVYDTVVEPYVSLNLVINSYRDLDVPSFARYRPLDQFWAWFTTWRRTQDFFNYDRELRTLMGAIIQNKVHDKAFAVADYMKALNAFHVRFLLKAKEEQKHLFRVTLAHHFPHFLKSLSTETNEITVDGNMVSPKTFERIREWCQRLEIEEPDYVYGTQREDP